MARKKKVLTAEERRGEEAFERHQRIVDRISQIRKLQVENIEDLDIMYTLEQYKVYLGDENAEWSGYLAQQDVFLTRAEVHRMSELKKKFVDEFGMDLVALMSLPVTKLQNIAMYAHDKNEAIDLVDKARTLTSREWTEEMRKLAGKNTPTDGHQHEPRRFEICKKCGNKQSID